METRAVRVIATLVARPGKEQELADVLRGLIAPTRAEAGCLLYDLWQNEVDASEFRFVEEWESEEALSAHAQTAHIQDGRRRMPELLAAEMDLRKYRLLDPLTD